MRPEYTKVAFAEWLLVMGAVGLAIDVRTVAGWTFMVGLGVLPLIVIRLWSDPRQRMSASIQEARR